MRIVVDNLQGPEILALLQEHLAEMRSASSPESMHALDAAGLRKPGVTFWTVWLDSELGGCGALKELNLDHGEIKSMRTANRHRRKGVAATLVRHMLQEAARRGYRQLSLETGSLPDFAPARALYASFGFERCGPFGGYREDPHSVFMTKALVRVVTSINSPEGDHCVDIFVRDDGTFGYEEYRQDAEDMRGWFSLRRFASQVFATERDARARAKATVAWLAADSP